MTDSGTGVTGDAERTTVAGRYRLLALVASGGMGRVWRAHDELLDREVAVKELTAPAGMPVTGRREAQLRTVREARAAARLDHPGVVRIFDVVQAAGRSWIVMEYVRSRSLHEVVAQDGPLTHQEAARVGLAVLNALQAAHVAGVLHLDVKPHNVLIAADGRVVLTDFGLATLSVESGSSTVSMDAEPLLGSPHYVAPERLRGAAGDARTDLWSLGATLYAAVEGRPPFDRPSVEESLNAVLVDAPDPPQRSGPLHRVITGLLTADPARRPSAAQAQAALSALTSRAVGVVAVPTPRRPTNDAVRFRPAAVTVAPTALPAPAATDPAASPAAPEPAVSSRPTVATASRSARVGIALAGAVVLAAATASVVVWRPADDAGLDGPTPAVATAPIAATACSRAIPQPVTDAASPAPYTLPDGWLWHIDRAAFALPVPRNWTRAADADVVCFSDPDGVRTLMVQPGPALTGEPLRHWQDAEQQALANGTLPGYRKVSMGVLLVTGGGADWEYTWQPPTGPRLHTHRVLRSAGGTRSYLLTWTTPDRMWDVNLTSRRTILDGVRDPSTAPSPWVVPAPNG